MQLYCVYSLKTREETLALTRGKKQYEWIFNQARVSAATYRYLHNGVLQLKCHLKWVDSRQHSSVKRTLNQKAVFVLVCITGRVSGASPVTLHKETFWNKEVRMLIKAGSTHGLVGSRGRGRSTGPSDSHWFISRGKDGVSKCKYSIFTMGWCY